MKPSTHNLPAVMSRAGMELDLNFLGQMKCIPDAERIRRCLQCGTCTGSCPVSYAMDVSPRALVALFRAGAMEDIMKSRTIWICASCYACTTRCPAGIKITDIIYALKRTAMGNSYRAAAPQVQALARLFTQQLEKYGRLHEGTLIRKYYMKVNVWKFLDLIPLGSAMWKTKRLALMPTRIRAHDALARMIRKARELEARHTEEASPSSPGHPVG